MQPETSASVVGIRRQRPRDPAEANTASDQELLLNKDGAPRPVLENIIRAMSAEGWKGKIVFDELAVRPVVTAPTPAHAGYPSGGYPRPWGDSDDAIATSWLQAERGLFVRPGQIPDAVLAIAKKNCRHPAREYLKGLVWDKRPRLDHWLTKYAGAEDSQLTRAVASKFLIGAVARACRPGVKNDHMPIFEGPQGSLKSTLLRELMPSPDLFTDDLGEVLGKEAAERIQGKWIVEVAELDAMNRAEATRVKSFITRQVDHFRPSYGRHAADFPRQCVFAGTTNQDSYLRDETGGRRFWPVRVGKIDIGALRLGRDQLWAEARARYEAGEKWWLDAPDLVEAASEEQRARFDADVWHEPISEFLIGQSQVRIAQVLDGLGIETARQDDAAKKRVAKTLKVLGWERKQIRTGDNKRMWIYRKSPVSPVSPPPEAQK